MTLDRLLQRLDELPGAGVMQALHVPDGGCVPAWPLSAVTHDSRQVAPGALFVALRGHRVDGATFALQAQARGAAAVVAESAPPAGVRIPWFVVPDARVALAALAAALHGDPSHRLTVIGITGTNGKTTTAFLVRAIFEAAGVSCGLIGTISYWVGAEERAAGRTTPEASDLQQLLREMVESGSRACAMEVSSHALVLKRVEQLRFGAAVFTNLTRDHLDFHGDMESYFRAKRLLFEKLGHDGPAIVNIDDPRGLALLDIASAAVTYGIERAADVTAGPVSFSIRGLNFDIRTPRGRLEIQSRLVGRPSVYNILAAVATGVALDLPLSAIERGVAALSAVPGRFEVVTSPADDVTVVVDYAHTDDALKNLLETARPLAPRRLITVFGCGGERDRTKRPLMGAVAARLSDVVVLTSDNPRGEDPTGIIEEIGRGIPPPVDRAGTRNGVLARALECLTIVDRREAIGRAVGLAGAGDMVLIAGKGHERYQHIGDRVVPFDDAAVARAAVARRQNAHVS